MEKILVILFIGGIVMTVEKHIRVRGSSNISWKDAIVQTISEASKTINYISEVKVIDQTANIQDGKITEYFAEIELTFYIDHSNMQKGVIMQPIETQKKYQEYVDKKSPNSPILKNCFNAFWVGGLICTFGQIISLICKATCFTYK